MRADPPRSQARRFLLGAGTMAVPFLIAHLLGLRQYTSVLSGTASFGTLQRVGGALYLALYGLFVVCVPVWVIAAGLARALAWTTSRQVPQPDHAAGPQQPDARP